MKGNKVDFICLTCNQTSVHYCRGMCNPCYQRHLRQRNKSRTAKIQTAKAQTPMQRMKRDDYPYTPPKVGPQFQVDLTPVCRSEDPERLVDLVHKSDCMVTEEMNEYLHFCKVVFTDSLVEGDIVKGSCCLEEQALKLLRDCNFNISRAKLAILFPIEYRLEPDAFDRITEEEVKRRVVQATVDLEEIKEEKREDYSKKLQDALISKVSKDDLEVMIQVARSIRVDVPIEVTEAYRVAEEFSVEASKLLEKRMLKPDEVQSLADKSQEFSVVTATVAHIQQLAKNCVEWEGKAEAALKGIPATKQLQALVTEGTSLQVDLPLLEPLRQKHKQTKKWAEGLHLLTKSNKQKKDQLKPTLSQIQALLSQAQALRFTHCEMPGLEAQVETVLCWKERLVMWSNDVAGGKMNIGELGELMEECEKLPLLLDQVKGLEQIKEMCQWTLKAESVIRREETVALKQLKALINEAAALSINSSILTALEGQLSDSLAWKAQAKQFLKGSDPLKVADLVAFLRSGESLKTDLDPFLKQISQKTERALEWEKQCNGLLATHESTWDLAEILAMQREMKDLHLQSEQFEQVFLQAERAQSWKQQAECFLLSYPKAPPQSSDSDTLASLLACGPSCLDCCGLTGKLQETAAQQSQWALDCHSFLTASDLEACTAQGLIARAQLHPVDMVLYGELVDHSSVVQWTAAAEKALQTKATLSVAKLLLDQAEMQHFTVNSAYSQLLESVQMAEKLSTRLRSLCVSSPNIEDLKALYAETLAVPLSFEAQTYLHASLLNHLGFAGRARTVLTQPSSYSQVQCLLSEAELLCCRMDETEALRALLGPCGEWREKAAAVLGNLPAGHIDAKDDLPPPTKQRLVTAEYDIMPHTSDLMEDIMACVSRSLEEDVVWNASVAAAVHPVQGLLWSIRLPSNRVSYQSDLKRKRIITQRIRELEGFDQKRESKRQFEIKPTALSGSNVCFCHSSDPSDSLQCRTCKVWFHLACLGLEQRPQVYTCPVCCRRREESYEHLPPCQHSLSLDMLRDLLAEGKALPLTLTEAVAIERLVKKGEAWQGRAREMLGSAGTEEDLVRALQEYEGLPFAFPEPDRLYLALQKLDWLQEAKSTLSDKTSMRSLKRLIRSAGDMEAPLAAEMLELLRGLEGKRDAIDQLSLILQRLLIEKASLQDLQQFLEQPEVKQLQFDKFESLRKDVAHTELVAARVAEALQGKRSDLVALEKLQLEVGKIKLPHEAFLLLDAAVARIKAWVEDVKLVWQDGAPSNDAIQGLLSAYQDIPCSHPLVTVLEEAMSVFCVCRQPDTGDKAMINCDRCKDWFHYDCVGIPAEGPGEVVEYLCPKCSEEQGLEYRFRTK